MNLVILPNIALIFKVKLTNYKQQKSIKINFSNNKKDKNLKEHDRNFLILKINMKYYKLFIYCKKKTHFHLKITNFQMRKRVLLSMIFHLKIKVKMNKNKKIIKNKIINFKFKFIIILKIYKKNLKFNPKFKNTIIY